MTLEEFHAEMEAYWWSVNKEANSFKDPYIVLERLRALYARFDSGECAMADSVIAERALEGDENRRYFVLALIEDLKIGHAIPSLRLLAERLAHSTERDASFWAQRATTIADDLAKQGAS